MIGAVGQHERGNTHARKGRGTILLVTHAVVDAMPEVERIPFAMTLASGLHAGDAGVVNLHLLLAVVLLAVVVPAVMVLAVVLLVAVPWR